MQGRAAPRSAYGETTIVGRVLLQVYHWLQPLQNWHIIENLILYPFVHGALTSSQLPHVYLLPMRVNPGALCRSFATANLKS